MIHPLLKSKGTKPRSGKVKKCKQCGKEFYVRPSDVLAKKFCSYTCTKKANVSKAKLEFKCKECGKLVSRYKGRNHTNRFCSQVCDKRFKTKRASTPEARSKSRQMRSPKMRSLDNLFSKVIRARDGKCLHCGKLESLQCSHVLPRTYISVRWNLNNAITLCYRCHIYWWHKYPHEAVAWYDELFPGRYEQLKVQAEQHFKVNKEDIRTALKEIAKKEGITL